MGRSAGTGKIAAALWLSWVGLAPCAAQTPGLAPPSPPGVRSESSQGGGPTPSATGRATTAAAQRIGPSPLATRPDLGRAPMESGDLRFPINLATALRLSDARPIIVAAAQAGVWAAEADLQKARVLWLPVLNLGFDYIRHDGGG